MSQEIERIELIKPVWVVGITKDPPYIGERPKGGYVFFELDKDNEEYKDEVLKVYEEMKIPVLYHRIRRGWHFFGDLRQDEVRRDLQRRLTHLNFDGSMNTTLRIKRKTDDEIFELPIYQGPLPMPNWCKALRYWLTLEHDKKIEDYDQTAKRVGLHKYFKPQKGGHYIIFYPLCSICLHALPADKINKIKHYQNEHGMYKEVILS